MTRVFISHSHLDKTYALKLADEMKRRGIQPWIDDRIDYGDEWPRVIQENLEGCPIMVVIMSRNSSKSKWVGKELAFAEQEGKLILPILLNGKNWLSLASTQYVNVEGGILPPDGFFDKILRYKGQAVQNNPQADSAARPAPLSAAEMQKSEQVARYLKGMVSKRQEKAWLIGLFKVSYTPPYVKIKLNSHSFSCEVGDQYLLSRYDPHVFTDYKVNLEALEKRVNESKRKRPINPLTGQPDFDALDRLLEYTVPRTDLEKRLNLHVGASFNTAPTDAQLRELAANIVRVHKDHHIPVSEIKIKLVK